MASKIDNAPHVADSRYTLINASRAISTDTWSSVMCALMLTDAPVANVQLLATSGIVWG